MADSRSPSGRLLVGRGGGRSRKKCDFRDFPKGLRFEKDEDIWVTVQTVDFNIELDYDFN